MLEPIAEQPSAESETMPLTKSERRKQRKSARTTGKALTGELALQYQRETSNNDPGEFTETAAGYDARHRWAERYDDLNGAPEGDWDR